MATSPEVIRKALTRVTAAAQRELRAVSRAATESEWRAAMFAAAPLIVSEYAPASATLALDWFEDIRLDAKPPSIFMPTPFLEVSDADVKAMVARVTESVRDVEQEIAEQVQQLIDEATAALEAEVQKEVAAGFWDTITENAKRDPDAVGWQRFARTGACKFCVMLADRGAVYTRTSVRFAAHTTCHCVVGPSYDPDAPRASVMQYVASARDRSAEDKARLRAYLNENFPDAPG